MGERRWSSPSRQAGFKFPEFDAVRDHETIYEERDSGASGANLGDNLWAPRRENSRSRMQGYAAGGHSGHRGHGRQKSLSDAFRTIRTRKGSVSQNAAEIAEALKAPVSYSLVALCLIWYMSSALTNTSSKSILNAYPKPVTLTIVQFAFVSFWCWVFSRAATTFPQLRAAIPALKDGLRSPSRDVLATTMPLALFQLGGHILSSTATQKIPVSLVHTIKGLSPLFTVMAYRFVFNVHYSINTYLSLIPLTLGVFLACSVEFSDNIGGIVSAFLAAIIFVAQNIFSKKLFNEAARAEADALPHSEYHRKKLDKLNLLFYCSSLALVLTLPLWMWSEGWVMLSELLTSGSVELTNKPHALDHGPLVLEFIFNGAFHFGQNIIAFILLSIVSPVTYSVASLIKRVFVILIAIVWFGSSTTMVQGVGIALTFLGLYLYDRTHDSARSAKHIHRGQDGPLLPLNTGRRDSSAIYESPTTNSAGPFSGTNGYTPSDEKKLQNGHTS